MLDLIISSDMLPKCMRCFPVERVCFIFGVVSCVISGFSVVTVTLLQKWLTDIIRERLDQMTSNGSARLEGWKSLDEYHHSDSMKHVVIVMTLYAIFMPALAFSVSLCHGFHKRRPEFVKAYLVYGETLGILMLTGCCTYTWEMDDLFAGLMGVLFSGVYWLMLIMIGHVYQLMRTPQLRDRAELLPEQCPKA